MRVYFAGLRAPIECKIMAACRIFAGATVTNISDKVPLPTLSPAPSCRPTDRPRGRSCRAAPYLYIDLPRTDTPPGIIFSIQHPLPYSRRYQFWRFFAVWAVTREFYGFIAAKSSRVQVDFSYPFRRLRTKRSSTLRQFYLVFSSDEQQFHRPATKGFIAFFRNV